MSREREGLRDKKGGDLCCTDRGEVMVRESEVGLEAQSTEHRAQHSTAHMAPLVCSREGTEVGGWDTHAGFCFGAGLFCLKWD